MSLRTTRWSLLTRFGVMSFLALAVLAVALAHVLKGQIEARALSSAEEVAVLVARAGVQPNLTRDDLHHGMTPQRVEELDRRLEVSVFGDLGIQRVKIFDTRPRIIYSDKRGRDRRSRG